MADFVSEVEVERGMNLTLLKFQSLGIWRNALTSNRAVPNSQPTTTTLTSLIVAHPSVYRVRLEEVLA